MGQQKNVSMGRIHNSMGQQKNVSMGRIHNSMGQQKNVSMGRMRSIQLGGFKNVQIGRNFGSSLSYIYVWIKNAISTLSHSSRFNLT